MLGNRSATVSVEANKAGPRRRLRAKSISDSPYSYTYSGSASLTIHPKTINRDCHSKCRYYYAAYHLAFMAVEASAWYSACVERACSQTAPLVFGSVHVALVPVGCICGTVTALYPGRYHETFSWSCDIERLWTYALRRWAWLRAGSVACIIWTLFLAKVFIRVSFSFC